MDDQLEEVLSSLEGVFDGLEPIDELSHALQCAELAVAAGCESDLITAALFHDVARSSLVFRSFPSMGHELVGASWLAPRFGERISFLAGAHVAAKLFLLATEPEYEQCLSPESKLSADAQGRGESTAEQWESLSNHHWWPDAVQLRRFDDGAKQLDVVLDVPERYLSIARPLLIN